MMLPEPGTTIRPPEPGDFRQGYQLALDAPHGRCLISTRGTTACYGGAWVYRYDGGDGWSLNGELVSRKGFRDNMGFGESVALQGDWAAVSSPDDLEERGSVSVYHREDEGKWAHHKLLISPSRDDLYLGLQINFDAQQLLAYGYVGFNLAECNRMHRFDIASGNWAHREACKSPVWMWTPVKRGFQPPLGEDSPAWHQPRTNDPMAVSGDWLVQGRPSWGTTGDAMIFHKGKDGSWQSIFRITPVEGADQRLFGGNLAMDESTFAVWSRDIAGRLGHVDVFQVNDSESECRLIHRLTYLWPGDLDVHMRVSIALGGRHLVMSTPDQGGRVHFYELDKLPVWNGNGNALYSIEMVTGENEVSQSLAENEITLAWQGPVEAAVGIAGQFYLFSQDRFQRIDGTSLAVVESGIVGRDGWDGLWLDGVEAACGRSMFGEAVFIKGDWNQSYYFQNRQYKNLEMKQDHRWTSADASFMHPDRNTYVFQGGTYFRRGVGSSTVEDSGSISDLLPGAWSADIDAAACPTGDDRLFLFKGKRFQVFDFSENRVVKEGALRYEASSP